MSYEEYVKAEFDPTIPLGPMIAISVPEFVEDIWIVDDIWSGEATYGDAQLGTFFPWLVERFAPRANRCVFHCWNNEPEGMELVNGIADIVDIRVGTHSTVFEVVMSEDVLNFMKNHPWDQYNRFPFYDVWFRNNRIAVLSVSDYCSEAVIYNINNDDIAFVEATLPPGSEMVVDEVKWGP